MTKQRVIRTGPTVPEMPLARLGGGSPDSGLSRSSSQQPATTPDSTVEPSPAADNLPNSAGSKEIRKIPLARLRIHPFNSRAIRTQSRIEEVRDLLEAEHTQRESITVVPGRNLEDKGYYYILSGQTRFHAATLAGWSDLDAQINYDIDPSDHLLFWQASLEHNTSIPETDWDLAIKAKALIDEGCPLESVQKAARRDPRGLRRLAAMTELPEEIQAVVREHPTILTAHFCELLKSALDELGVSETTLLAKSVAEDKISVRDLKHQIDLAIRKRNKAKVGAGTRRSTRESKVSVMVGSTKVGDFKVMQSREQGKKQFQLSANIPAELEETFKADILAAIEKLSANA